MSATLLFRRRPAAVPFLLAAALACACNSDSTGSDAAPPAQDGPYVSAHAGGTAYAPDNTLTAFRNAIRLGVDELEMDTFLTADGRLVILHDQTLDRTTDCSGDVSRMDTAGIEACDAAYWWEPGQTDTRERPGVEHPLRGQGIRPPFADEVFAEVAALGAAAPRINIEIKIDTQHLLAAQTASALVSLIQGSGLKDRVVVQSFIPWALDQVKLRDRDIRVSFLVGGSFTCNTAANYAIARGYEILSPEHTLADLDASCVGRAQAAGVEVLPWTVDREADLQRMIELGVDGIITNFPGCLLRLLGRPLPQTLVTPGVAQPAGFPVCAPPA